MRTTPLPPSSYAGSKILGQTVIGILSILVIFIAAAVGEGVQLPVLQWVESILWIAIGSFPFMALGILIGLVGGVEGSAMIGNGVYFILSILGGLWWPLKMMPAWIQALAKWTPTFSLGDGAWKIVAGKSIGLHDISVLTLSFLVLLLLIVWMARRNLSLSA
ncbi:ABC transporter permease [Alicyclobacillus sp. SO9]|uniref:ABC transporter permease n=1 Tax=Alicyclobacillus sp. SO9 TaxID=2665646 RepID=UPI0018E87A52|nr:ABC transporter permease [Alicyclobacillus sp. SO9]